MKLKPVLHMPTTEDVPIQQLTTEDFAEIMRQHEVPVMGRHGAGGPLRQIRITDPKPLPRSLDLHSKA